MAKRRETVNFPEDIIEQILYNLPVKSLLRFKCLSKRWRSVISSEEFIKHQLKKSNTNPNYTHHGLLFKFRHRFLDGGEVFKLYRLRHLLDGPITNDRPMRRGVRSGTRIWSSINGLFLISLNNTYLYLSNLLTRKFQKIQLFHQGEPRPRFWDHYVYGFGYDESTDEYKVVCIYTHSSSEPYKTHIYSSKTGSWKRIEDFDRGFPGDDSGKFVNGKLHWLAVAEAGGGGDLDIVSLDLVEEKYGVVAKPVNVSTSIPYQTTLGDLGGYLSWVRYEPMLDTNIWVMKKYGVRESWTKIWTLSDCVDPKRHVRDAMPLFLKNNGDIVVALGSGIVVYNGKNKLHECRSAIFYDIFGAIVCVSSLVSPSGG